MLNETTPEPRYDCPVCIGAPMHKLKITHKHRGEVLTLDCCKRCGGVWFDAGEIQQAQHITSPRVRQQITQHTTYGNSYCQSCHTLMDRNLDQCPSCGWQNQIACPVCEKTLKRTQHKQLTLDVCHHCQGVWFDQVELSALWNHVLDTNESSKTNQDKPLPYGPNPVTGAAGQTAVKGVADSVAYGVEGLLTNSDLAQYMVNTTGKVAQRSLETLAQTPEIAGGTVKSLAEVTGSALETMADPPAIATVFLEVTGEVAGGMTEALAEILAGLFTP